MQLYSLTEIIVIFTIMYFKTDITYSLYFPKISVNRKGKKKKKIIIIIKKPSQCSLEIAPGADIKCFASTREGTKFDFSAVSVSLSFFQSR